MYATVSLLDEASHARVVELWQRLETRCGLVGIKSFPIPHFTYQSAESYDLKGLKQALQREAVGSRPFDLTVVGFGVFPGPNPVVYLSLVKTPSLMAFHQRIWERVLPFSIQPNPHYAPGSWIPHISLALVDVNADRLSCALRELAFEPVSLEIHVQNLAVVCQEGSEVGRLRLSYSFERGDLLEESED